MVSERREFVSSLLNTSLDKALGAQAPLARGYVKHAREASPEATPAEILAEAERRFLNLVTTIGAAAGASAAVPGIGTAAGFAANIAEVGAFVEANVFFVLMVAEIHGLLPEDPDTRRALVLASLLGDVSTLLTKELGGTARHWAGQIAQHMPDGALRQVNQILGRKFLSRWGTKQGVLVLGRELPVLIGAGIGGLGNRALAKATVKGTREVFGPPPDEWGIFKVTSLS
jgi:hypothetical protein